MTKAPFDACNTLRISEARESFLRVILLDIREQQEIATALDAGCGFGFFSRCLLDLGLRVLAIDGRSENVAEAKRRNPGVEFKVYDIEAPSIAGLGRFDLVLCFGLLSRISDLAVVPYRQDQSLRLEFWGSDVRNHTTEGDTRWVNYNTSHSSSRSTAS